MMIEVKRVYEKAQKKDGVRILVDRIWPRGLRKEEAKVDHWLKDIAPSDNLRKWFSHDPEKWPEFKRRYFKELNKKQPPIEEIARMTRGKCVTLIYGAKDERHNNAVALKEYLDKR
jgi:uncharacterized protein YeaO (DUF488 family)